MNYCFVIIISLLLITNIRISKIQNYMLNETSRYEVYNKTLDKKNIKTGVDNSNKQEINPIELLQKRNSIISKTSNIDRNFIEHELKKNIYNIIIKINNINQISKFYTKDQINLIKKFLLTNKYISLEKYLKKLAKENNIDEKGTQYRRMISSMIDILESITNKKLFGLYIQNQIINWLVLVNINKYITKDIPLHRMSIKTQEIINELVIIVRYEKIIDIFFG